jgi:regulator of protease activity HflC (stomatin/prohibitin superfamily)
MNGTKENKERMTKMLGFIGQVRPTQRCIVERFGKYARYQDSGLVICIPIAERARKVNITEKMVTCKRQEVITGDNLNAGVSAQVYYKIKGDEQSVKNSQYNVNDVDAQIVSLAQTTLRNVIGGLSLRDANSQRADLNKKLQAIISNETSNWGIEVVRCEIAEIDAPKDVQTAMNEIVKAESEKRAAIDYATAAETKADGEKRAAIKKAEGAAQSVTIAAEANATAITVNATAKAEAIRTVNNAAKETFVDAAVDLKKLEVAEQVFKNNSKIIVPEGSNVTTLISDLAGVQSQVLPIKQ